MKILRHPLLVSHVRHVNIVLVYLLKTYRRLSELSLDSFVVFSLYFLVWVVGQPLLGAFLLLTLDQFFGHLLVAAVLLGWRPFHLSLNIFNFHVFLREFGVGPNPNVILIIARIHGFKKPFESLRVRNLMLDALFSLVLLNVSIRKQLFQPIELIGILVYHHG